MEDLSLKRQKDSYQKRSVCYNKILTICKKLLTHPDIDNQEIKSYLDSRISPKSQKDFEFGYFPNQDNLNILLDKFDPILLKKLKLIYTSQDQNGDIREYQPAGVLREHNLIMPNRDMYGNIVGFIGRSILPEYQKTKKYIYAGFEKKIHPYNLFKAKHSIHKKNAVVIVEGQIDCITCCEFGIDNVVALGGSEMSKQQFFLLSSLTDNFILLLDGDEAGKKAQKQIINRYSKYVNFKKISLPSQFKDVDQYLRNDKDAKERLDL